MFIFDLSNKQLKLPPLQNWLNPNFTGMGDLLVNEYSKDKQNNPKNFKQDFPDYVYKYQNLMGIKNELNKEKGELDSFSDTPEKTSKFFKVTSCFRSHDLLRGRYGYLHQEYGAEVVTNAWLKMFENMSFLDNFLNKINKSKEKKFNSIHLAEAPGNFILAINHYLKTNYPKIEWEWLANSYKDLYSNKFNIDEPIHYLEDVYGLMRKYKNRWLYGTDGDGDITSTSNIISFKQEAMKCFKGDVHFVTSDVKYSPSNINYNEEENYNIPVHLGHLLCSLELLSPGGIMMLKEFTFFEASSVSLLYLMANCFEKLLIVKPETSKPANSEVYIFGINYKANLTELQIERLFNIMNYIRYLNTEQGSPAIFQKEDIPESFVDKIAEFSKKLADAQIPNIKRNIELYIKYQDAPHNQTCKEFSAIREKMSRDWIAKTKIKPLNPSDKIGTEIKGRK